MTRGKRDFASVGGLSASRFDLTVDPVHADEALRILSSADTGTVSQA
jgi:hypothetical protein